MKTKEFATWSAALSYLSDLRRQKIAANVRPVSGGYLVCWWELPV